MKNSTKSTEKTNNRPSLKQRLKRGVRAGKKMLLIGRIGLGTTIAGTTVGTGYYAYRQFHKSPEQIRQETVEMGKKVDTEMQKIAEDIGGTNKVSKRVGKVSGKIAKTGASHGGAVRAWIAKKLQKQ